MSNPKGNMYEGWDTINYLAGPCPHNCAYCSTKSLMKRFPAIEKKYSGELRLDPVALNKNIGHSKSYFVCGQNDLFADKVPANWIADVFEVCAMFDNEYLFQTKNPARFLKRGIYENFPETGPVILCTTIETNRYYPQMGNTPLPVLRADAMSQIKGFRKSVTLEPLFAFDLDELIELIRWCDPEYCSIGADSKNHHLPEPSSDEVKALITELKKFTEVKEKSNLKRLL